MFRRKRLIALLIFDYHHLKFTVNVFLDRNSKAAGIIFICDCFGNRLSGFFTKSLYKKRIGVILISDCLVKS